MSITTEHKLFDTTYYFLLQYTIYICMYKSKNTKYFLNNFTKSESGNLKTIHYYLHSLTVNSHIFIHLCKIDYLLL